MEARHFTKPEAEAKVGRKVQTSVAWSGVPKGTTGQVVRADSAGRVKLPFGESVEVYDVAIQWDLPAEPPTVMSSSSAGERFTYIRTGKPLMDSFTKSEYEKYLVEL